jgi:hypothetical protein
VQKLIFKELIFNQTPDNELTFLWFNTCSVFLQNHFLNLKQAKRIFFYLSIALLVLLSALAISAFLFKDRIIQQFVGEANKYLNTPVKIGKIDVSLFDDFPHLAIVFTDVYIEDSHPGNYPLLTADKISFTLNPIEVWKGNFAIRKLTVLNSETNLKINSVGIENFNILKTAEKTGSRAEETVKFDLREVSLIKSHVSYSDQQAIQHHIFNSENLLASISVSGDLFQIEANGDILTEQIKIKNSTFLTNKNFLVAARLDYDDAKKEVRFKPSSVKVKESEFTISGNYLFSEKNRIDLKAIGKNTDIQTLLSLMPDAANDNLKKYRSKGEVFFNMLLRGEISETKSPALEVTFGCTNTTLFHPDFNTQIKNANLQGSFKTPAISDFSNAVLSLRNVTGTLNEQNFQANFLLEGFTDPYIRFDFKGDLDAASINNFYPNAYLKNLTGFISADIAFEGQTAMLKQKATVQRVKTNGAIVMSNVNFEYGPRNIKLNEVNGTLQFNKYDLALSNVSGKLENSDFRLNGFFKNIITFLLFENQPIGIETDLKSDYLDVDQLFVIAFGAEQSDNYLFSISPDVQLNFNCDVKRLKYKRFHATNLHGDLLVKNQVAVSRNINVNTMGGALTFNGIVDSKNPKTIEVVSTFKLNGIEADSVFYVFENFGQTFIQDKHLKGQVFADVEMEMTLTPELKLIAPTLIANISASIKNGQLNNFEPLKSLNKYLDDEGLSRLRFADLKNEIHIENQTIYIPQMEIKSNVTDLKLSGTHTFDQRIDYRIAAPLNNRKKVDPDEAFGAIEEVTTGKPKIYLKITGTTDSYEVSLDKEALKKKISSDLKKEVQELKDAFKQKGVKKKKELELSEEEFDWENN